MECVKYLLSGYYLFSLNFWADISVKTIEEISDYDFFSASIVYNVEIFASVKNVGMPLFTSYLAAMVLI